MGIIAVLPPDLASQIAAGEVVERPASAVKELVENSLDAGASRCDVEIEGGGITRLSVRDDAGGMTAGDARLCVERHATSKIRSFGDLTRVGSYGFRGEALPSIASVSRFTLRTRARNEDAGVEVRVDGGGPPEVVPAGLSVGTIVEVRDLFFNVPARRKFLRSSGTESGHVTDVLEAAALSHPTTTFTLRREGRPVREWLRAADRESRVRAILDGVELSACRAERGPVRLEAFLSRPERARTGAAALRLLVNGRPVKDRALALSVAQAYGSVLERGRYPRGVVYLEIPPELLDVNVHPQKAEVRFADPRAVNDAVYSILSAHLSRAFALPAPSRSRWAPARPAAEPPAPAPPPDSGTEARQVAREPLHVDLGATDGKGSAQAPVTAAPDLHYEADPWGLAPAEPPVLVAGDAGAPEASVRWSALRFVAQLRKTYLLCEGEDALYIVDQHAAAERVNFDRLRRQYGARSVASQAILFPVVIDVTPSDAELVEEHGSRFAEVGFDVRVRSSEAVSIHGVPRLLSRASPERLLRDLLAEISRRGGRGFSDAVDLALSTLACHGSIRAGDAVSPGEARALLEALDRTDFAGHCPHGRPIVNRVTWTELERKVGRR